MGSWAVRTKRRLAVSAIAKAATIGDLLEAGSIHVGVRATNKSDLLRQLIDSLAGREGVTDLQAVAEAVMERESMLSTGVGYGIALPHAKTSGATRTMAVFATTATPIEYDSFDNQPVRLVFMLIGPRAASREHVRILGRISRLLQDEHVREQLLAVHEDSEVVDVLHAAEESIPSH